MNHMNHMNISLVKSALRMTSCIVAILAEAGVPCTLFGKSFSALFIFAAGFGLAEVLGVLEEIYDKRKED